MTEWWQRFKIEFEATGWTIVELSGRAKIGENLLSKYLNGEVQKPRGDAVERIADALGCDRLWLKEGVFSSSATVRLTGILLGNREVRPMGTEPETAPRPGGIADALEAIRVETDALAPIYGRGDIIYYEAADSDPFQLLGKDAVLLLADQRRIVRFLSLSPTPGHFQVRTLLPSEDEDAQVVAAYRIAWVRKA